MFALSKTRSILRFNSVIIHTIASSSAGPPNYEQSVSLCHSIRTNLKTKAVKMAELSNLRSRTHETEQNVNDSAWLN